jgi:hypothetical protein
VHNVRDVRQMEVHIAEPLVLDPSRLEVEIVIAKLKRYKSLGSNQIPAELIQAGGETLLRSINSSILFGIKKNCLIGGKSLLFFKFTKRGDKTDCNNYQLPTKFCQISYSES